MHCGAEPAGFADYEPTDDTHVDFVHTKVDEKFSGQGLAGKLVAEAVADVQGRGKRIIPHCEYVADWLTKHTEYDEIVDQP